MFSFRTALVFSVCLLALLVCCPVAEAGCGIFARARSRQAVRYEGRREARYEAQQQAMYKSRTSVDIGGNCADGSCNVGQARLIRRW